MPNMAVKPEPEPQAPVPELRQEVTPKVQRDPKKMLGLEVLKVPKPMVKLPRRWQPWKFVTVAMVIPWLLTHATQRPEPRLSRCFPAATLRKASLPAVLRVVPMHEANWPK